MGDLKQYIKDIEGSLDAAEEQLAAEMENKDASLLQEVFTDLRCQILARVRKVWHTAYYQGKEDRW